MKTVRVITKGGPTTYPEVIETAATEGLFQIIFVGRTRAVMIPIDKIYSVEETEE